MTMTTITHLPDDVLRAVLSGVTRTRRRRRQKPQQRQLRRLHNRRDSAHGVPYLDPRWLFVARGVCRLWRYIIEHPTAHYAKRLGAYARRRSFAIAGLPPLLPPHCPKWATGRVVCASAILEWVAARTQRWCADPEGLCSYLADLGGATRKHIFALLLVIGEPWAVHQAYSHHWPLLRYNSTRPPSDARDELCEWDHDGFGFASGLLYRIGSMLAARGNIDAARAFIKCFGELARTSMHAAVAAAHGQADLLEWIVLSDQRIQPHVPWSIAAAASTPACVERLLDMVARNPQPIALPAPTRSFAHSHWITGAVRAGRLRVLKLLVARGVWFDEKLALYDALGHGHVHVARWLFERDPSRQVQLCVCPALDLYQLALDYVKWVRCESAARCLRSLRWLCEDLGFVPEPHSAQLEQLVRHASDIGDPVPRSDHGECALYISYRWPERFFALGPDAVQMVLRTCALHPEPAERVLDFFALLATHFANASNSHGDTAEPTRAVAELDLWCALESGKLVPQTTKYLLARSWRRTIRALRAGKPILPCDVRRLFGTPPRPCTCATDADWSHPSHDDTDYSSSSDHDVTDDNDASDMHSSDDDDGDNNKAIECDDGNDDDDDDHDYDNISVEDNANAYDASARVKLASIARWFTPK